MERVLSWSDPETPSQRRCDVSRTPKTWSFGNVTRSSRCTCRKTWGEHTQEEGLEEHVWGRERGGGRERREGLFPHPQPPQALCYLCLLKPSWLRDSALSFSGFPASHLSLSPVLSPPGWEHLCPDWPSPRLDTRCHVGI